MKSARLLLSTVAVLAFSHTALAYDRDAPLKKADGILVTQQGQTVYTFDKDVADNGKSACYGGCAAAWPVVPAGEAKLSAPYGAIARDDGVKQLTYKGKPLYFFAQDRQAGDRNGDNVKEVWHVVKD